MIIKAPAIDPIIFSFLNIDIHWYGLMYTFGFMFAIWAGERKLKKTGFLTKDEFYLLIFYCMAGVVIGGRTGYYLFYEPSKISEYFYFSNGGMSFHGGLFGVITAIIIYSYKKEKRFLKLTDFIVPLIPFGLGAGRLGNFINGELWGKVSSPDFGMLFANAKESDIEYALSHPEWIDFLHQYGSLPRYPSQLIELFFEGIVLFIIIGLYSRKERGIGKVYGLFLTLYSLFRIGIEYYFREPDEQLGLFFDIVSMGQILSFPALLIGLWLLLKKE